jgi:hypothetical protein
MIDTAIAALRVGPPAVAGPLAVFPVHGDGARLDFRAFAEAAALGATVTELPGGASVGDLLVRNPLDVAVLLYEGEEVRGAQQDRTLDVSVLVAPGATLKVPVSCVEAGRWEHHRADEAFTPAPQAAFPTLRRAKSRAAATAGRAEQHEVWSMVGEKAMRHAASSETGALRDVFSARDEVLREFASRIPREEGQLGAVAAIGGQVVVVDVAHRADVWAALHGPLVAGYALDAVEHIGGRVPEAPELAVAERLLEAALAAPGAVRPGVGLGAETRFATAAAQGARLVHDGELVALTAFPGEDPVPTRVRRPSRRRPA